MKNTYEDGKQALTQIGELQITQTRAQPRDELERTWGESLNPLRVFSTRY